MVPRKGKVKNLAASYARNNMQAYRYLLLQKNKERRING